MAFNNLMAFVKKTTPYERKIFFSYGFYKYSLRIINLHVYLWVMYLNGEMIIMRFK